MSEPPGLQHHQAGPVLAVPIVLADRRDLLPMPAARSARRRDRDAGEGPTPVRRNHKDGFCVSPSSPHCPVPRGRRWRELPDHPARLPKSTWPVSPRPRFFGGRGRVSGGAYLLGAPAGRDGTATSATPHGRLHRPTISLIRWRSWSSGSRRHRGQSSTARPRCR